MNLKLLKEERKKSRYSQQFMAEMLGFKDKSSYCLIENGKISINVDTANRIADILSLNKDKTYEIFFATKVQETSTI